MGIFRSCTFGVQREGPHQGLPMVGFCLPNEKERGMSYQTKFKLLLSG